MTRLGFFIALVAFTGTALAQPTGTIAYLYGPPIGQLIAPMDVYMVEVADSVVARSDQQRITEDRTSYRLNSTSENRLTSGLSWSPDGTRLAFGGRVDGNTDIYVMDADGSNEVRITTGPEADLWPSWSPDGSRIAYQSGRRTSGFPAGADIFVVDANGGNPVNLTNLPDGIDVQPSWSPDGSRIAFASDRDITRLGVGEEREIYVMNADGSNPTRLTESPRRDGHPNWSPDGSRIAFSSMRDGNLEIYVVNADGSGLTRLTDQAEFDDFPVWSPDGQFIAYQKHRQDGGGTSIWIMRSDGTDPYELVSLGYGPAVWRPTGSSTAIEAISWGLLKANWR